MKDNLKRMSYAFVVMASIFSLPELRFCLTMKETKPYGTIRKRNVSINSVDGKQKKKACSRWSPAEHIAIIRRTRSHCDFY